LREQGGYRKKPQRGEGGLLGDELEGMSKTPEGIRI